MGRETVNGDPRTAGSLTREGANDLAATQEYRSDSDTMADFLAACCTVAVNARDTANRIYAAYTAWATESGEPALSQRKFGQALKEREGISAVRSTGGRYVYHGVRIMGSERSEPSLGKPPETLHGVGLSGEGREGSLRSLCPPEVNKLDGQETQYPPTKSGEVNGSEPLIPKLCMKNAHEEDFRKRRSDRSLRSRITDNKEDGDAQEPFGEEAGPGLESLDDAYLAALEENA